LRVAPFLQLLDGQAHGFDRHGRLDLGREVKVIVGRATDVRVVIHSGTVARRHLELRRQGEGWLAADLLSTNGTFLNGAKVKSAPLVHRDVLELPGGPVLRFLERDEPAVTSPVLEAAIANAPRSPAPYRVYGDWLQEQGDPLGAFINTPSAPGDEVMRWTGTLAAAAGLNAVALEWRCGFFAKAQLTGAMPFPFSVGLTLKRLFAHRLSRFLSALRIELVHDDAQAAGQAAQVLTLLEQTPLPQTLETVRLFTALPLDAALPELLEQWKRVRAKNPFLDDRCF
jgi:uncharacterized protein (TIGR02996 family)